MSTSAIQSSKRAHESGSVQPLHLLARAQKAIEDRNPVDLQKCIELGLDPNAYIGQNPEQPALVKAASAGSWHCLEVLLQAGADPRRAVTLTGTTPLRMAAARGHLGGARLLLAAGDDPNTVGGHNKQTPVHIAAENGFVPLIELLEQHGGDLLRTDGEGNTPLHLSLKKFEALGWLAQRAPAALNMRNSDGKTPLMAAIDLRLDKSALALLDHDQDLSLSGRDDRTAAEIAKEYGLNDVATRLQALESAKRSREAIAAIRAMDRQSTLRP